MTLCLKTGNHRWQSLELKPITLLINLSCRTKKLSLDGAKELSHIPTTIVNGRYDVICPCKTAFELYEVMPHADIVIVPNTGHSSMEEGTSDILKPWIGIGS